MSRNQSHPPEYYAKLRDKFKKAGVKEKRFKVLATDVAEAEKAMAPLVNRAAEALQKFNDSVRAAERKKARS